MPLNAADEPPIDLSLNHYLEERALAIALEKADTTDERRAVQQLLALRAVLQQKRAAYLEEATRMRHARGEIYSAARVAAINAMSQDRATLDRDVKTLYMDQPTAGDVLKVHARVHFADVLVSARLLLRHHTPDIINAARVMQSKEEAFAEAWLDTIADASFSEELRLARRNALRNLRTSTQPIYLCTHPPGDDVGDDAAQALGKTWNKLDELASAIGVAPLSDFIGLPNEDVADAQPAARVLASADALLARLAGAGIRLPSKRATIVALGEVSAILQSAIAANPDARAAFDVDT